MESLLSHIQPYFESQLPFLAVVIATILALFGGYYKFKISPLLGKKLPPGAQGFPLIGESIGFLKAQKNDKTKEWLDKRLSQYGPIFKTSLMGSPVVVLTGQAGNKFIFSANDAIASNQPVSVARIIGAHSIFELQGKRHKLVRGAMMNFLRPESIQRFVGEMDSIIKEQLLQELKGKDSVHVVTMMKKVTFKVTCSLLFGLPEGKEKDALLEDFTIALKGTWAIPIDFPGTIFRQAVQARDRITIVITKLVRRRKKEMEEGIGKSREDIISSFLLLRDADESLLEDEIVDNIVSLIIASHDTAAIVLTLLLRHLARDTHVYDTVLAEHKEIIKTTEGKDGKLKWNDVQKMKYTWRVAQELMRVTPPVFGNFKKTTKDTSFGGFDIPKGWQLFWVACATHMDEKIFQEPEKFDPSRFENPSKSVLPYTYVPFGAGPRGCPGVDFARIEMLLIIHHLITNYRWTEMIPNEALTREPMPYPAMGLPIKLHPRTDTINCT
ncbi:hypothetical protein AQUCO_04500214v1 [Aquilegia coerulea]|uniref:Cytochrome P450 n=1 Tax=Aquilegia coerulea TaxID=218851 RepID=A0A2G5CMA4_AQUCA|nr:hypothetical protein AQUCO_04500214v1 [Aquilegia coerulea]